MPVIPRIDSCGKNLDPKWFTHACGRNVTIDLNALSGGNFSPTAQVMATISAFGSDFQIEWSRASVGIGALTTVQICTAHSYISEPGSRGLIVVDCVKARIDGLWTSSTVITVKASSYLSGNPAFSRSVNWSAYKSPIVGALDGTITPISRTQNWNDNQTCSGAHANWGEVTVYENGTVNFSNL